VRKGLPFREGKKFFEAMPPNPGGWASSVS